VARDIPGRDVRRSDLRSSFGGPEFTGQGSNMNHRLLKPRRRKPPTTLRVPALWGHASAQIVAHLDDAQLPERIAHAVSLLVGFEYSAVFVYRAKSSPLPVFDSLADPDARAGLRNYVRSTYVLNPFYAAYRAGIESGVYRMSDLAPDAFFSGRLLPIRKASRAATEEIGFLTEGWPAGRKELCIALELPHGECAEIALSRSAAQGRFSDADVARLVPVIPFLEAAFRHYWRRARKTLRPASPDTAADDAFHSFGGTSLSPRERELAQLLLRGHSTVSVALHLGISPTTVKTHRKNLYAKLGIATQYELFALFLGALGDAAAR
jgi:DNA-binding CsgD family transcriptional regulator